MKYLFTIRKYDSFGEYFTKLPIRIIFALLTILDGALDLFTFGLVHVHTSLEFSIWRLKRQNKKESHAIKQA